MTDKSPIEQSPRTPALNQWRMTTLSCPWPHNSIRFFVLVPCNTVANRIVVKAGTSIISNSKGYPSLSRMGAIVEQCAWLNKMGKEVILVSSGAVGVGRQVQHSLREVARIGRNAR